MITNAIVAVVCLFVGWTFPEPQFMVNFYAKIKGLFVKKA